MGDGCEGIRDDGARQHAGAHRIARSCFLGEGLDTRFGSEPSRVLLLGEDNPQSADPRHALYDYPPGCAGHRLRTFVMGLPSDRYLALWRTNLCNPAWSLPRARERAKVVADADAPWDVVVMLGAKVAGAMAAVVGEELAPFRAVAANVAPRDGRPFGSREMTYLSLPHPSGRARAWNDRSNFQRARDLLALHVPEVPWGSAKPEAA